MLPKLNIRGAVRKTQTLMHFNRTLEFFSSFARALVAFLFFLSISLPLASAAFTTERRLDLDDEKGYHIGAHDVLEITVYGEEDLTREVQVTASGYISYPLLGRIRPLGLTVIELEDYIHDALAKDYIRDPQVSVFIKEFSSVYVLGQVNEPGSFPFEGGLTVLEAISIAGGFSPIANKRRVRIVRNRGKRREAMNINVSNISKGNAPDISIFPGDKIIVGESFF
jgi:protein involved in polysaccharide export with SLBB domain